MQYLGKKHTAKKVEFLETFSPENWDNLKERKTKPSLIDCKGCLNNQQLRSYDINKKSDMHTKS